MCSEPRWHLCPCGHGDIATGRDFQKIPIFPEQTAANTGQGAFRISLEANLTRLRFEPAHLHRGTSQDQNQHNRRDGWNRKRESPPEQPAARILLARIDHVQGQTARDQYARASPRMRVSVIQMTRTSRAMDQWRM